MEKFFRKNSSFKPGILSVSLTKLYCITLNNFIFWYLNCFIPKQEWNHVCMNY